MTLGKTNGLMIHNERIVSYHTVLSECLLIDSIYASIYQVQSFGYNIIRTRPQLRIAYFWPGWHSNVGRCVSYTSFSTKEDMFLISSENPVEYYLWNNNCSEEYWKINPSTRSYAIIYIFELLILRVKNKEILDEWYKYLHEKYIQPNSRLPQWASK